MMSFKRLCVAVALLTASGAEASAQVFSVPIRWCVIGDDANGNGRGDPGELGAPAFTNPGIVGEVDTDNVLWRRHERPTDAIFIPEAQITFRSGVYNIVEDPNLRFPIIPDPDPNPTGEAFWQYGDILNPNDSGYEWNLAHNACVAAWRDVLGVEDIGVVVINANRVVGFDADSEPGVATSGGRRILLRDNAYVLPGSSLNTFPISDHVDKHFAHEMGHALGDLRHTCSNVNVMSTSRTDPSGDGLVDNIHLSTSIAQVTVPGPSSECVGATTMTVNQVQQLRTAAQATAGCKIAGTNTDCTSHSDIRADRIKDAPAPHTDLSTFTASHDGAIVKFTHESMGPFPTTVSVRSDRTYGLSLDYYAFIDRDLNPATGGEPKLIDVPVNFMGAEIITRVRATFVRGKGVIAVPTVWRFTAGAFQEVSDRRIRAIFFPLIAMTTRRQTHLTDQVTIELPTAVFGGAVVDFRLQAAILTVVTAPTVPQVLDLLDEDPKDPSRRFRWRSPTFPVCSVTPGAAQRLEAITIQSTGLLPNRPVHLIFGDRHIANGTAGADGSVSISTAVPGWARDGLHLITVGTDGTALTADCTANVRGGPQPPDTTDPDSRPFEYASKLVCGIQRDRNNLTLARGAYRTVVNIRNPGPAPLTISKELVLTQPPGGQRQGDVLPISDDELSPGNGLSSDCDDIARRVFNGQLPASIIEAWLVVRSRQRLDVSSVHTAAPLDFFGRPGGVRSIEIERIEPTPPPRTPAQRQQP